jgi:hypothetical protein
MLRLPFAFAEVVVQGSDLIYVAADRTIRTRRYDSNLPTTALQPLNPVMLPEAVEGALGQGWKLGKKGYLPVDTA